MVAGFVKDDLTWQAWASLSHVALTPGNEPH